MEAIVNTARRPKKRKNKEEEDGVLKKAFVPNSAHDLAKLQLEKLMKDPDKLVEIPQPRKQWKPRDAPEFVRHVMGSSAGAGSGEFHVYRGIRERETKRNEWLESQAAKEEADREYHEKIEKDKKIAEEKTAKKRNKRLKKKRNRLKNKKEGAKPERTKEVEEKDAESSPSEQEEEEGHFVIGGR